MFTTFDIHTCIAMMRVKTDVSNDEEIVNVTLSLIYIHTCN